LLFAQTLAASFLEEAPGTVFLTNPLPGYLPEIQCQSNLSRATGTDKSTHTREECFIVIPQLEHGVLPSGIHTCTLEECKEMFGKFSRSDRRIQLTEALHRYVGDVRSAGIALSILVDGSYVTSKPEPNDIDLILVLRPDLDLSAELQPIEYNVQSKRAVKKLYGFDVRPAIAGSQALAEYVLFFSQLRLDDPEQPSGSTKGILRIEL
jgi:hypothetical protein